MNVWRFGVSGTKMKALNADGIPQFFLVFLQKKKPIPKVDGGL